MHVLFVHRNFPAQFGHIASHLTRTRGWRCTFVSERPPQEAGGVANIQYTPTGGAKESTHVLARTFENAVGHAHGVYEALKPVRAAIRPDLIVGHSGFGSTVLLPELFPRTPVVGYFEWYYHAHGTDLDFRAREFGVLEQDVLRAPLRNAMIQLDLETCTAGYSPTAWQRSQLPAAYREKVRVLHDGIDTTFWRPRGHPGVDVERTLGALTLKPGERLVTYVSRGLESMRGFDVFLRAAQRVLDARGDVRVVVVGRDEVHYGGDLRFTEGRSFKDWVLERGTYDLDRITFAGNVQPDVLAQLLSLSDAHVYLTTPFVLSWSMLDAMACEAPLVASATPPVEEVVTDGVDGRLVGFFDEEAAAARVLELLEDPAAARATLGAAARRTILERYAMDVTMPEMASFLESQARPFT